MKSKDVKDKDAVEAEANKAKSHGRRDRRPRNKEYHEPINKKETLDRNSIDWITKSPTFPIAARFPLSTPAGVRVSGGRRMVSGGTEIEYDYAKANVFAVKGCFTCGSLTEYNSPANMAIRQLWLKLRSKFSGTIPVTLIQLYLYVASTTQLVAALGWLDRLAFTIRDYAPLNRIRPEYLLTAQNCDAFDFKNKQDQVYFKLAQFKQQLNALVMPKAWPIYADAYHCFHNYYKDSVDNEQAQIYFRAPVTFGLYDSQNVLISFDPANLDWEGSTPTGVVFSVDDVLNSINQLFDAVLNDTTIATVSGFLARAIEEGERYTLDAYVDLQSKAELVYDAEDLLKLHNIRTTAVLPKEITVNAGTGNNYPFMEMDYVDLFASYNFAAGTVFHVDPKTIDPIVTNPSAEVIAMASRYHAVVDYSWEHNDGSDTKVQVEVITHETFLPYLIYQYDFVAGELANLGSLFHNASDLFFAGNRVAINTDFSTVLTMGPYKIGTYANDKRTSGRILGDVFNPQPYDVEAMKRLHTSNLLSLFGLTE